MKKESTVIIMETRRCFGCMQLTSSPFCENCGYPAGKNNESHQLSVGTVLHGQYVVGKVLGQGGFGITYLGWDAYLEIPVAIKEYYPNHMVSRESAQSPTVRCFTEQVRPQYDMSRERFLREAKALARFQNEPAIVSIKNFFPENDTAYIVMEYVQGTDLAHYINMRGGRLSVEETLKILEPVMDALSTIHQGGLIHRDISPDNIMLHPKGGAKLLDFGAVRDVENPDASKAMARSTEAILKHGFAPLEQYQSRGSLGPWTDVYALCATIYYCLTGRIPEDSPARVISDEPMDWDRIPGLNQRQIQALTRGMAPKAPERLASVAELKQALYSQEPVPAGNPEHQTPFAVPFPVPEGTPSFQGGTAPVFPTPEAPREPAASPGPSFGYQPPKPGPGYPPPTPGYTPPSQSPVQPPKKKTGLIIAIVAAVLALVVGGGLFVYFGVHFWSDATCYEKSTCSLCGKTRGRLADHDYTRATCTEGSTCIYCGREESGPLGHSWEAASCTAPAYCLDCGMTQGTASGHSLEPATCEDPEYCLDCGETFGAATGHDWMEATYSAPKTCRNCGETVGERLGGYYEWVSGSFEKVYFGNYSTAGYFFDETYYQCTSFTVEFTPIFNSGVFIKEWNLMYLDQNNNWQKGMEFMLTEETATPTMKFDTPTTVKGVAIVARAQGGYTFSFYLDVVDLYTR